MAKNEENIFKRLTKLFRSGPVIKRKVKKISPKTSKSSFDMFRKTQSQVYSSAMNAYGTYDRLARYSDFCFSGDTLVYTTEGVFSFEDLVTKFPSEKRFHVYSYDPIDKKIKIANAHSPRISRDGNEQEMVKVTFSDGGHIIVTPDHPLMLRSGDQIKARDLKEDDSLMPFYVKDINGFGYNFIYTMDRERCKGGWQTEHLVVAEHFSGRQIIKGKEEVHHIDFDKKNNRLSNLRIMDINEHKRYHAQLNNKNKFGKPNKKKSKQMFNSNPVKREDLTFEKILDTAIEVDFSLNDVKRILNTDRNSIIRRLNSVGINTWKDFCDNKNVEQDMRTHYTIEKETTSPEIDEIKSAAQYVDTLYELSVKLCCTKNAISRRIKAHGYDNWSHFRSAIGLGNIYTGKRKGPKPDDAFTYQDICNNFRKEITKLELARKIGTTHNKIMTKIYNNGFKSFSEWKDSFENHKVSKVETLVEKEIVYNITVENYHNLAVGSLNPSNSNGTRDYSMVIAFQSEMEYCLHGDTLIATDRGFVSIKELAQYDKPFVVYSFDHTKNKIVPAMGRDARMTRRSVAYKVMLESGESVIGTPDHRLMLSDGTYRQIQYMQPGDSLMAYIDNDENKKLKRRKGYLEKIERNQIVRGRDYNRVPKHITFPLVLNLCEKISWDINRLAKILDISYTDIMGIIENATGILSWEKFVEAYYDKADENHVSFQDICNAFHTQKTMQNIVSHLGRSKSYIMRRLKRKGYNGFKDFKKNLNDHVVKEVELYSYDEELYDLTVDGYKNFATNTVISHNTPELASALDIYAEESASPDENGNILHIYSDNPKIKELLDELFIDTLNVDFNLTSWVRNLCKYGDFFLFNDVAPDGGVVNAFPIPVSEIEREEGYDPDDPLAVRFRWVTQGNQVLENWQVTHLRLLGNDAFLPYGSSVLESARRIWRQLVLLEDSMLVYRIVRSPERRVFYIDVGNVAAEDVENYLEQAKNKLKKSPVVDKNTGKLDVRNHSLSVDEDYVIPVRGQESGTRIETLAGGQNATAIEDIEYTQRKLFSAIKIPKAYLGYDEGLGSKATLSQEDIRFSRTISRIQRTVVSELNKLAIIHLACHGFTGEDLVDFNLKLSIPSTIAQQQKLEIWTSRFNTLGAIPEGMVSKRWMRKTILKLTDDEIEQIDKDRIEEKLKDDEVANTTLPGMEGAGRSEDLAGDFGGGGGGLGDIFGGDTGLGGEEGGFGAPEGADIFDTGAEDVGEEEDLLPDEENASVKRTGRFVNEKDRIKFTMSNDSMPIMAQNRVNRILQGLNIPPKRTVLSEIDYKNATPEEKQDHLDKKKEKYHKDFGASSKETKNIKANSSIGKEYRDSASKPYGVAGDLSEADESIEETLEKWASKVNKDEKVKNEIDDLLKTKLSNIVINDKGVKQKHTNKKGDK